MLGCCSRYQLHAFMSGHAAGLVQAFVVLVCISPENGVGGGNIPRQAAACLKRSLVYLYPARTPLCGFKDLPASSACLS